MVNDISIALPEEKWRAIVAFFDLRDEDYPVTDAINSIESALPAKYPNGTIAWVTYMGEGRAWRNLAERSDGGWRRGESSGWLLESGILKVEPILTPGDVVVKAPTPRPETLRAAANILDGEWYLGTAEFLTGLADQIEKQKG